MQGALVLDVTYRPIDVISEERAVTLCVIGKAVAILNWEGRYFHSQNMEIPVPKVISLKVFVPIPKYASKVVTNTLLFARDNYTCQFCGRHEKELKAMGRKLTREHLKPVASFTGVSKSERRKKANDWSNVVAACNVCNNQKGARTPSQAKMRLISDKAPKRPTAIVFTLYEKVSDPEMMEFVRPFIKDGYVLSD